MDILFKSYFVFFRRNIERGADAAVFVLSIPLGLNFALIFFFALSLLVDLKDLGGPLFGLCTGIIAFSTGMLLRYKYISEAKYKLLLPIKYPTIYCLVGIIHYVFSVLFFIAAAIMILDKGK